MLLLLLSHPVGVLMAITRGEFKDAVAESRRVLEWFKGRVDNPLAAAICGCAMIVGYSESHGVDLQVFFDFMKSRDPAAFAEALGVERGVPQ